MRIHTSIILAVLIIAANAQGEAKYASVLIDKVPHVQQKTDFCGEACAEMFLAKLGHDISQDDVFNLSGLDPARARGCHTAELARALYEAGFKTGKVWHKVTTGSTSDIHAQWESLHARYLCYYLQEKGLLTKFYHQFQAHQKKDPSGYETLQKVLGEKDMARFKKDWEEFVLKLRFP